MELLNFGEKTQSPISLKHFEGKADPQRDILKKGFPRL
jgi:hypothetical protein